MKKLINDPRHVVRELLEGAVSLAPNQALLAAENVVVQFGLSEMAHRPVAVISGGGAGHEPAHAGYVGSGMLAAAVAGDVFTSPSVDAVLAAIHAAAGPAGAVLIVKNYTGDRLNFGLAAELATAAGIPTRVVVVADDVALHDTVEPGRRRGIAGTVFVHKIAGAAASAGLALDQVAAEATAAASSVATMGVALGSCTVPAAGKPGFTLEETELELGLGIHGEQGVRRAPMQPVDAIVDTMLDTIITQAALTRDNRVALLVNGLGGTPPMELAIVARRALAVLRERGLRVERAWIGNFMTALEMPGCSLTLLALDDARLARLDAPTQAPAWPGGGQVHPLTIIPATPAATATPQPGGPPIPLLRDVALSIAAAFEREEAALTELDSRAGDGDLGISMARGAAAIRSLPGAPWTSPATALTAMGDALRRAIAGSSGPFYATALLRAAREIDNGGDWAAAFAAGAASVTELGGAKPGDRTMVDALDPAATAFTAAMMAGLGGPAAWQRAVSAAEQGAANTATMRPRLGRAAYLGDRAIGHQDAGAAAVLVWMRAIQATLNT
ncbi:dihydroxyacetone kinase family protein [Acidisphaera sp. L21]|uniref:dihydroxyacetone kinase family protein n=1 Tax=Acidisphaera sp. L21 TaxID=1641851 RepID=UPI00131E956D|nr:dihydroxyacetone kinase family protein [Acidisphaera sp. L21]